jgi:hypothetical protein
VGLLNLFVAPAARWDASWYLEIARFGYFGDSVTAFFPLYPGLLALGGWDTASSLLFGIAVSSACSVAGLYLVHRIVARESGEQAANATTWIIACSPAALCFSAVYTEGLFLLLSVGSLYAARCGRWRLAGLVGALAAATRSAGLLLMLPLAILYLYGPRADRQAPLEEPGSLRPRYSIRPDALWIATVPLGIVAYLLYLGLATGEPMSAFSAQAEWSRIFAPLAGVALGAFATLKGILEFLPGIDPIGGYAVNEIPQLVAFRDIVLFGFLALALWLLREAWRRLPTYQTAHAVASLALPLSFPATGQPLMSLPRFMLVIFPLWAALGLWSLERGLVRRVLIASMALLAFSGALFTTWASAP